MSALLRPASRRLDLSKRNRRWRLNQKGRDSIAWRCAALSAATPAAQPAGHVGGGAHPEAEFTGKGDLEIVDAMYKEFFDAVAHTVEELMLNKLEWGGGGVRAGGGAAKLHGLPQARPGGEQNR